MAPKPGILLSATLACLLALGEAEKCRTGCGGVTPSLFKYAEGTTYKYNLEGNIDLSLSSAEGQHTNTKITAVVLLTQQAECNQVLRLQNVQVIGPDAKKYTGLANIDKPVRLNFHDGHVENVICTDPADTQHSLNIKRAVASLFQAATGHHGNEEDVFGNCHGDISQRKDGNNVIIQKTRDLTTCSNREAIRQDFIGTSFNLKAVAGTGPLFANYESEQRIKNGILDHAIVTENYLYKPFSDGKSHGAKAIVTTKLTFTGQKKENVNAKVSEPRSINFDAPHQEVVKSANVDSILNALKETKKTMDISVTEKSAKTFLQLIRVLRASRKDDILAVYGQIKTGAGGFKDKEGARKVFFDALFRTGTGEAVEVIVELLKNKELSSLEQKLVYISFSFIRHATKGALTSAITLLDQPDLPREAYLGISTLAHRYCAEHSCNGVEELNKLQQKLISKVSPTPANRKAENDALAALKALSSIYHLSDAVADKIAAIYTAGKAPTRLRVAALEAAASDACHTKVINSALSLLKNRQEDSEIRIKAYLVLVQCPDQKVAQAIKELVENEPVYQVGGYISSHLRNLRASTDPARERAQQYLGSIKPSKNYPIDPRKYSFNTEISSNWDTLGAANSVEADVIYSQNSWVPRSVGFNVSGDVLGHRYNFVEVNARQENLDRVLEHYFGPLGVLRQHSPEDLVKSGKESIEKIVDHVKQRLQKTRGKRDVSKAEIEAFAKTVKILGSEFNKDLDLDLNVKIFGSELLFLSINEDIQKLTPDAVIDKLFDCLDECLDKAKDFEYHLKNHLLLTDLEVAYPTSTGFPLRWAIQGTAAVHFITSGKIDLRQILKNPKDAALHLKIIPSANIEYSGNLQVDAHFVTTGLKVTANVLTSTGSDLTVKLMDGKGVDVKLGLPVEKQKLVSFSHHLDFASQELGKPEVLLPLKFKDKQREFSICFDQLSPLIGLTFCGEFNAPSTLATNNVGFPYNGHSNFEISIDREDVNEYHFQALFKDIDPHTQAIELSLDTPGSKTNRHFTFILQGSTNPSKYIRATLKSPLKDMVAEIVLTDTNTEKSLLLRFQYEVEYLAKIGVIVKGNPEKRIYQPLLEYSTPGDVVKTKGNRKPDYNVEGQIVIDKQGDSQKFTFDHVKLIAPGQSPIQINGYLSRDGPTSYSTDLQVSRDSVSVTAKGKLQFGKDHLKLNAEVQNTVNPGGNFNIKIDLKEGEREYDNSLVLIHGSDLSSKKHCLTLSQSLKYNYENTDNFELTTKNKVTYPLVGLEGKFDAHVSKKHYSYDLTVAYDKFKLESELDAKVAMKVLGDYDVKFEVEVINNKVELKAKREVEGEKSKVHNYLEICGKKYQVDGTVTHHVKPNDINIGTDLVIKIHEKPDAIKVDTGLISNSQSLDSHAKILVGSNTLVDIVIKGARGPNPNGNLKIVIQNLINANGNFKLTGGKGTGQIVVDVPKMGRKIKAETQITCQEPVHNAVLNIYFDFEKDNSKKIHIETNNHITKTSYDTKNKIDFVGQVVSFNSKGQIDDKFPEGKVSGQFDLTLPNNDVLSGTLDRQLTVVDDVHNGNVHGALSLQHGGKTCKLDVKGTVKDTNFEKRVFDIEYNIVANHEGGKDLKVDLHLKHQHDGDKHHSVYSSKIYGSFLPKEIVSTIDDTYSEEEGVHYCSVLYGDVGFKCGAKFNIAGVKQPGVPVSGGFDFEVLLPSGDKVSNFKIGAEGKAKKPEKEDGVYEADGSLSVQLNNKPTVKLTGNVKASIHSGDVSVDITLPNEEQIGAGAKYSREKTENGGKIHGEVDLKYGKDKEAKAGITLNKISDDEADVEFTLATPSEHAKDISLKIKSKRSSNHKNYHHEVILNCCGKRYAMTNEIIISEISPSLDIIMEYPDGKQSRILVKFNRLNPKEVTGELKILSIKDFSLEANGEANLASVDDFHILINVHSEKLKLDKVKFEASNKPAKGGKKIQFSAKSGDKNLLSGSTSYKANEEGGKFIVEGSGSVKVKDETKTATFKFMKQHLEQEKDGEQGTEVLLNAGIGSQGIVAELKVTNKQFRILNSYCEEKKQCAHVEVFSKTNTIDAAEFNNELEINIDLRKLGLSHEFGLKSVTNRKDFVLDHTVDVHFESSASSKYQYSLYIHPKEAGIQFTTPKRVISLEAKGDFNNAGKQGSLKGELAFYLNKNAEPNKKTAISYSSSALIDETVGHSNYDIKFTTPGLGKDLAVSYADKYDIPNKKVEVTLELDIFAKKNQKISIVGSTNGEEIAEGFKIISDLAISSKGINLDFKGHEVITISTKELGYDLKVNYQLDKTKLENAVVAKGNAKKLELLVKALNKNVLHVETNMDLSKETQTANTKVSGAGFEDFIVLAQANNFNTISASIAKKSAPGDQLRFNAGCVIGQIADIRLECEKGGKKIDIAHASIKLDDTNFLKPDFNVNSDFIQKQLIPAIQKENQNAIQKLKTYAEDTQKTISNEVQHVSDLAKKSVPNLKPATEYYKQELLKLKEELVSDKTIQEVSEFLKTIFSSVAGVLSEFYTKLSAILEQLAVVASEQFTKITDVIAKDVLPYIKEVGSKILDVYLDIMKNIYDVAMIYVVKLTDILKKHQDELKQVATIISESLQDVGRLFVKFFDQLKFDVQDVIKSLLEQIKVLFDVDALKERYEDLVGTLPDTIVGLINEFFGSIAEVMPTDELKTFFRVVQSYIEKKLAKEKVDDAEAMKQIYAAFVKAINSLIRFLQNQQGGEVNYKTLLQNIVPVSFDRFSALPNLVSAKLSPVNYLLQGDLPSIKQLVWGQNLNPKDNIPPVRRHAIIAQGQHIFTFDDRHLTFPGKCSYVLAKDAINGNFTLIGQYKDGSLEAITFSDKHDIVTLKKNHQVTHNGEKAELPIRTKELEVFRLYETIHIVSKAGVQVAGIPNLDIVSVHVSGFYHGQLRGLLGNGNFEPYDDFVLPNGKVSANEADFGNGYKLQAACGAIKTVDHSQHHSNPKCNALFGEDSDFKLCYPFVPPETYRQACEHGLASGIADTEKYIAVAYGLSCRFRNILVNVPDEYIQCTNSEKPVPLNEQFSVKTPRKAADVVVIIEQNKANEVIFKDLIQPVITQLTNELTAKGISDVEFSIVGYGGPYSRYPSHYTQGGKLAFHGTAATLKFADAEPRAHIDTGCKQADEAIEKFLHILEEVKYQVGAIPEIEALYEGLKYPFRAHAAKTVIWVRGSNTPKLSVGGALVKYISLFSRKDGIHFSLVEPLDNIKSASGKDAKQFKQIVGFNDHTAYTLADAKKKGEGNAELRKDLDYGLDHAADYALERHGGNVFVTNAFTSAKGGQKKQYIQVMSHVIAEDIVNTEYGMDCQCVKTRIALASNVCKVVSVKEKEARKGGVKG